MSYGLPRKLRFVFIVQLALVTLAVVIGAWLIGVQVKHGLFGELLREDAAYYWDHYRRDPDAALPDSRRMRGLLVSSAQAGKTGSTGILALDELEPGFHDMQPNGWLVWVDDGPGGRLYLLYDRNHAQGMIWWVAVAPVLLVLLVIYLAAWYSYRASRELVIPINQLARRVADWDPRQADADTLDPADLGDNAKGETHQLALVLHEMAQRVRAHIQREHEFTRDASHELRTPLTVIRVATDVILADPDLSGRQRRNLQRIARAGGDMEEVIESQLLLARETEMGAALQQVDVAALVTEEADKAREQLQGRPIQVRVDIVQALQLQTSAKALSVVIRHLLGNACKYTEQGEIVLCLEKDRLLVSDTGIGMSSDELRLAFEPFYRVDQAGATGAGLGLSIVRRLCDRFGWSIGLESQPGKGTRATLGFSACR